MKLHRQSVFSALLIGAASLIFSLSCGMVSQGPAQITVNAAQVIRQKPDGIGGVVINAHSPEFATNANGIDFQADLKAAKVKLVRNVTYPDNRAPNHRLDYFDRNVRAIVNAGATPLLIQYIKPGLPYFKADGSPGGTVDTNLVFLVKHYRAAPYNLRKQYWEIGNEPDLKIDYRVSSPQEYVDIFNRCHEALVKAGLRDIVILAGPSVTFPYRWPQVGNYSTRILSYFLEHAKQSVDVITYHNYSGGQDPEALLNQPHKLDNLDDGERPVGRDNYGVAALRARMQAIRFARPNVGVGITEHNAKNFKHEIGGGLWNLALTHYYLYNPVGRITTAFAFDNYGSQQQGFGHYDPQKRKNYSYWALWINGNLRGPQVLARSVTGSRNRFGRSNLLVTATKDANHLYIEVINRRAMPLRSRVELTGARLSGPPLLHVMATGVQPNQARRTNLGARFDYEFPPLSASIFKFPLS